MKAQMEFSPVCPLPISEYPQILLAHGGGGKLMHDLIESMFVPRFRIRCCASVTTSRLRRRPGTDGVYDRLDVVKPLFFPGGDIGSLAVNGTVNDLAMCGAPSVVSEPRVSSSRKVSRPKSFGPSSSR